MIKKIFKVIFEPFKIFSSKGISEGTAKFFSKYPFTVYIVTLAIAAIVIFLTYKV